MQFGTARVKLYAFGWLLKKLETKVLHLRNASLHGSEAEAGALTNQLSGARFCNTGVSDCSQCANTSSFSRKYGTSIEAKGL